MTAQLQSLPPGLTNLDDHAAQAQTRMDEIAWAYFSGGAGDEYTLRDNRDAWTRLQLQPRILRPVARGHTRISLFGRTLEHPVLLAPVAYQRMAHGDGELASAYAAAAQGAGFVLSMQTSVAMQTIAQAVQAEPARGPMWFQLYMHYERGFLLDLVRQAEEAGYEALVVTVDAPTSGVRDRERRSGFRLPDGVSAVHLAQQYRQSRQLEAGQSALFDDLLLAAPGWDDLAWLKAHTRLPVLIKGVLHEEDARIAAGLGVDGIVVSNHGGRTLDTTPATAAVLPRIAQAVGSRMPVLVDGGIRRGTDVLKAIALGANAVLIGRPYVHGLANAGAMGVAHVIRLLRDELEVAMALSGVATLEQVSAELLFRNS